LVVSHQAKNLREVEIYGDHSQIGYENRLDKHHPFGKSTSQMETKHHQSCQGGESRREDEDIGQEYKMPHEKERIITDTDRQYSVVFTLMYECFRRAGV